MRDIAERVGVSATTVSLVLNNKPGASEEMRERILRTAREMGYAPPRLATTGTLCLLHIARHGHTVNRDHDVFLAEYIEGLGQAATAAGFSLEILTFKQSPIEQILETALAQTAEGFIVLGTELDRDEAEAFAVLRKPLVFIDTFQEFSNIDFVDMNNADSIFLLLRHLHDMGHRSIGFVQGAIETRNLRMREEGFLAGKRALGLDAAAAPMFYVDQTFHGAAEAMRTILADRPALPTALVCANDIIACGCLKAFAEAGIAVPDEVSIVGFDDLPLSAVVDPPLTTIRVSKAQIGAMALQLVAARVRGAEDLPSVKVQIGGRLVERASVRNLTPNGKKGRP
jgi:LacI family transcriptional regulator